MIFLKTYFQNLKKNFSNINYESFDNFTKILENVRKKSGKVIIMGNGGSASIASHFSTDLTKVCNIRTTNFNEANLITCLSNDYGYEQWLSKAIEFYADEKDVAIFISSSGKSKNILNGIKKANKLGLITITFSGFSKNNKLKKMGLINFWVNSKHYNYIETTHLVWLLAAVDFLKIK